MLKNNPPKIAYLLKTYPKISETFILNEILELEKQGLSLEIFSLRQPQDNKFHAAVNRVRAKVTYIPSLFPKFSIKDFFALKKAHLQLLIANPLAYFQAFRFYLSLSGSTHINEFLQAGYLALKLRESGIEHLHAHFANIPTAVAEIVQQFNGNTYSFTAHAKDIYLSDKEALDVRIKKAKFVLTCTEHNLEYLQGISTSNTPIYLSYHGIDLERFQPKTLEEAVTKKLPLILSVGRLCEKKGFHYLLQACNLLKQKGYQFRCEIVGYGSLYQELKRSIEELNIQDLVFLIGKLTQEELIEVYAKADIFVLPCQITDDGDRDGIPNVLLEAMAMEVPVISTNISGISELIQNRVNGILVPQKDPQALAGELENLLVQPQLSLKFKQASRDKICQQFSLTQNIEQIKNLLLNVSANAAAPPDLKSREKVEALTR